MLRRLLYVALAGMVVCCELKPLYKFRRIMMTTGKDYYKIKLTMGKGEDRKLYTESKVWGSVRMSRILDIYYKSSDPTVLVSKVDVHIILNHTDVYGRSEKGVGYREFSGFVVLPTRSGIVLYSMDIYSVSNSTYTAWNYKTVTVPAFATKMDTSAESSDDEETDLG